MRKYASLFLFVSCACWCIAQQTVNVVEPTKYKGYHTLTLFDSTQVYVEASGLSLVENHKRMRMLDYQGCKDNSTLCVDYDPLSAYVEIREVIVHRYYTGIADTLRSANTGVVYDYVAPARLIYWGASQKMVQIGHLDPRDEIEIRTFRKGYTYALLADNGDDRRRGAIVGASGDDSRYIPPMYGHFYDIVPFWSLQPVSEKVYSVDILSNKNLHFAVYNDAANMTVDSVVNGERTIYTFKRTDIMPLKREPFALANNDIECKLLLSTAPNWQSKSIWFYGVNEDYGSFRPTDAVKKKVSELLKGIKTEKDSISILTHWVADNIRYCGISMGEGEGYTLHNAEMNFTDRCGVCKDKAGMLVTMLRAAGFKAYAAMTMAGERIDRIPADQFNHSVCVVQHRDGRYELLDPTWVPNVRELWSSAEQQQGYLMGLPDGADLMETPLSPAENHYVRLKGSSTIKADGTLVGQFTITAEGQSDAAVRRLFSARQSEWSRNLELELLRVSPRAVIEKVSHTDNDNYLKQPVSITYKYSIPNYAIVDDETLIFIPLLTRNLFSMAMGHLFFDTKETERTQPFKDRCSRLVEIYEEVTLPAEYDKMDYVGDVQGVVSTAVNYGGGFQLEGKKLIYGENAMYNKRVYDAADWPAFRQAVLSQKIMGSTHVVLHKNTNN